MMYRPEEVAAVSEGFAKLVRMFSERWRLATACQGGVHVTQGQKWGASLILDKDWFTEVSVWGFSGHNGLNTRVSQKFLRVDPAQIIAWIEKVGKLFEDSAL